MADITERDLAPWPILPERVRRNYQGGMLLDQRQGLPFPADGDRPEDWIASITTARNPGMPAIPGEGLTRLRIGDRDVRLADLAAQQPRLLFGRDDGSAGGDAMPVLAKLLDSSMRLHVQAHPTTAFAREHLDAPYGKFEAYVVLAARTPDPYLRLGFQRAPSREAWRRIIAEQRLDEMDACFDRIPIAPGEVWIVPGGVPHAIGPGVLLLEIMEPSDLVVRCEFTRDGIVVPPGGRFMGRDLDFCLDVFDYQSRSAATVAAAYRIRPRAVNATSAHPTPDTSLLIGPEQTPCFRVYRSRVDPGSAWALPEPGRLHVSLVETGTLLSAGADGPSFHRLDSLLIPGALHRSSLIAGESGADVLSIVPGPGIRP